METIEKQTDELTEREKKQVAFGRMLMASKRELQEEARRDWEKPEIRAIVEKQIEHLFPRKKKTPNLSERKSPFSARSREQAAIAIAK